MKEKELELIQERYNKRNSKQLINNYLPCSPYIYMSRQEKERKLFSLLKEVGFKDLSKLDVLEVGCGRGDKILDLLQMGFAPERIIGNELMKDNVRVARERLPEKIKLFAGDARVLNLQEKSLDIVYQSMVFSSILDKGFRIELAGLMWRWVKPGGGILWYDFIYNNPKNKDVRGVGISAVKQLFPLAEDYEVKRLTLAPPISRKVTRVHPNLYGLFNTVPFLRSHVLCFIKKKKH